MKKQGFTLLEIVIGMVVIGIGLIAVVTILQYATKLTNNTKSHIVAINLAREGVETIYNKRDSNWKMFSSKKDQCRLVNNPEAGNSSCENLRWFTADGFGAGTREVRTIITPMNSGNTYFITGANILKRVSTPLNIATNTGDLGEETTVQQPFRLCLYNNTRDYCTNFPADMRNHQTPYGRFWRGIRIIGLYDKDHHTAGGGDLFCETGEANSGACGNDDAKELRFCSRVDYIFDGVRTVELCSVITNFVE